MAPLQCMPENSEWEVLTFILTNMLEDTLNPLSWWCQRRPSRKLNLLSSPLAITLPIPQCQCKLHKEYRLPDHPAVMCPFPSMVRWKQAPPGESGISPSFSGNKTTGSSTSEELSGESELPPLPSSRGLPLLGY